MRLRTDQTPGAYGGAIRPVPTIAIFWLPISALPPCFRRQVRLKAWRRHVAGSSNPGVSQARDTRGFPREHEEIKISATIHERRFVLLADLCDQRHRTMVLPGNLRDYVEIFDDLIDCECGVVGAVHDRVALELQQRR